MPRGARRARIWFTGFSPGATRGGGGGAGRALQGGPCPAAWHRHYRLPRPSPPPRDAAISGARRSAPHQYHAATYFRAWRNIRVRYCVIRLLLKKAEVVASTLARNFAGLLTGEATLRVETGAVPLSRWRVRAGRATPSCGQVGDGGREGGRRRAGRWRPRRERHRHHVAGARRAGAVAAAAWCS